jgi:hypothetical protein
LVVNGTLQRLVENHSFINQTVVANAGIDGRKMLNHTGLKMIILFIWVRVEHIAVVQVAVEDLD